MCLFGHAANPDRFGSAYGWMKTADGVFVVCEPNAASTWFPSSDHPADKATYDIRIKAPKGLTAVSNGRLVSMYNEGDTTVTHCGYDAFHLARRDGRWKILNISDTYQRTECGPAWPR